MKTALVFGASGQIGMPLLDLLRDDGWRTYAVSRQEHPDQPALHWLRGDLSGVRGLPNEVRCRDQLRPARSIRAVVCDDVAALRAHRRFRLDQYRCQAWFRGCRRAQRYGAVARRRATPIRDRDVARCGRHRAATDVDLRRRSRSESDADRADRAPLRPRRAAARCARHAPAGACPRSGRCRLPLHRCRREFRQDLCAAWRRNADLSRDGRARARGDGTACATCTKCRRRFSTSCSRSRMPPASPAISTKRRSRVCAAIWCSMPNPRGTISVTHRAGFDRPRRCFRSHFDETKRLLCSLGAYHKVVIQVGLQPRETVLSDADLRCFAYS